jgi:hypothetical protein
MEIASTGVYSIRIKNNCGLRVLQKNSCTTQRCFIIVVIDILQIFPGGASCRKEPQTNNL